VDALAAYPGRMPRQTNGGRGGGCAGRHKSVDFAFGELGLKSVRAELPISGSASAAIR
jgi:hypothetical protein